MTLAILLMLHIRWALPPKLLRVPQIRVNDSTSKFFK
jgi:hypothetical protein